ncbi:MAG: LD-carboxypeptidase [Bacteroidota bacterium]
MQRRDFHKQLGALAMLATAPKILSAHSEAEATTTIDVKPRRLEKGDTIGVITPGSYISDKALEKGIKNLESLGLKVKLGQHIRAQRGFTAGTDQQRLDDLHRMFEDREVQGIWCARGGYGCTRLLPDIRYDIIRDNPKVFIGYSDITALLQAFHVETGLIGFHAAVASSDFTRYTRRYLRRILFEDKRRTEFEPSRGNRRRGKRDDLFKTRTITSGRARGRLFGGNLSLLAALAGTPWELKAYNKLIFLEEVGEKPYRVDRMLTQLRQSAYLQNANGIAMGIFNGCEADRNDLSLTLQETLDDRVGSLQMPSTYGLSFGHIDDQIVLPVGIEAELDADSGRLTLLESAVR